MRFITLADVVAGTDSIPSILELIKSIFQLVLTTAGNMLSVMKDTPLLFIVIVLGLSGSVIGVVTLILIKLGVLGGGRRGRRSARR